MFSYWLPGQDPSPPRNVRVDVVLRDAHAAAALRRGPPHADHEHGPDGAVRAACAVGRALARAAGDALTHRCAVVVAITTTIAHRREAHPLPDVRDQRRRRVEHVVLADQPRIVLALVGELVDAAPDVTGVEVGDERSPSQHGPHRLQK